MRGKSKIGNGPKYAGRFGGPVAGKDANFVVIDTARPAYRDSLARWLYKPHTIRGEGLAGDAFDLTRVEQRFMLQMVDLAKEIDPAMLQQRFPGLLAGKGIGALEKAKVPEQGKPPSSSHNVQQRKKRHHPVDPGWTHDPRGGHRKRGSRRACVS